jgi:cytochrome P450
MKLMNTPCPRDLQMRYQLIRRNPLDSPGGGMTENPHEAWDPRSAAVLTDQIAAYDSMRQQTPIAYSDFLGWSVFHHDDTVRILNDPQTFSNAVSRHLNVPNGMDPPKHTKFRRIIDRYFTDELVSAFEPDCREIAQGLVASLPRDAWVKVMSEFAEPFALQVQSAYLGWPEELQEPLRQWTRRNHAATLAQDRTAMGALAEEFDGYISDLLDARRTAGSEAPADLTTQLLSEEVDGRRLTDAELVSLLRNWTVGELGTIAASVGIIAHYLSADPEVQTRLRADLSLLPTAIDEILRIHAPLISNRRVTARPTEVGGQQLDSGERLTLLWASANRDEAVFGDPDEFRLDRDPENNLLYWMGIHVCPGASLARLELRVLCEELLGSTRSMEPAEHEDAVRAVYPGSGFAQLPLWFR